LEEYLLELGSRLAGKRESPRRRTPNEREEGTPSSSRGKEEKESNVDALWGRRGVSFPPANQKEKTMPHSSNGGSGLHYPVAEKRERRVLREGECPHKRGLPLGKGGPPPKKGDPFFPLLRKKNFQRAPPSPPTEKFLHREKTSPTFTQTMWTKKRVLNGRPVLLF